MTKQPDNVFISNIRAIDSGVLFWNDRLKAERDWEAWSRGDLTTLIASKSSQTSIKLANLTDGALFSMAADYYANLMTSSMPIWENVSDAWITVNKHQLYTVIQRAAKHWAIYGKAVFMLVNNQLQALESFKCVPISLPYDRNQIQGYVILQPMPAYRHPQIEVMKDGMMENRVRVTRYLPDGYTYLDEQSRIVYDPTPITDVAEFKYAGNGGTGSINERITDWSPSEVQGVWYTEPIEPYFPAMADSALEFYRLMSQYANVVMRFTEPILATPGQPSPTEAQQLAQPGAKVLSMSQDGKAPMYIQVKEPTQLLKLIQFFREQALAAASLNEAALGITGVLQESGISRRMQMTDALARIKRGREAFAEILPLISVAMGSKSLPIVRWEGTPLETVDARIETAARAFGTGFMTMNEARSQVMLPATEDGDRFISDIKPTESGEPQQRIMLGGNR